MKRPNLCQRITVQRKSNTVDPTTGYPTLAWVDRVIAEPAEWLAGPGQEFLASEALRAQVSGRFVIRYCDANRAITAGDRVVWDTRVMEVKAPPLVDKTARRWLTLMVAEDGSDGA